MSCASSSFGNTTVPAARERKLLAIRKEPPAANDLGDARLRETTAAIGRYMGHPALRLHYKCCRGVGARAGTRSGKDVGVMPPVGPEKRDLCPLRRSLRHGSVNHRSNARQFLSLAREGVQTVCHKGLDSIPYNWYHSALNPVCLQGFISWRRSGTSGRTLINARQVRPG